MVICRNLFAQIRYHNNNSCDINNKRIQACNIPIQVGAVGGGLGTSRGILGGIWGVILNPKSVKIGFDV